MTTLITVDMTCCEGCGADIELEESYYSSRLDGYICSECIHDRTQECGLCEQSRYLESFVDNRISSETLKEMTTPFEEFNIFCICNRCIDDMIISCVDCDDYEIIDLTFNERQREFLSSNRMSLRREIIRDKHREISSDKFSYYSDRCYCERCYSNIVDSITSRPPMRLPSSSFKKPINTINKVRRHVGIEAELIYPELIDCDTESFDRHDFEHYVDTPDMWEAVYDGSLSSGGAELRTSSPIVGDDIDKALYRLNSNIQDKDAFVDDSCGIHIHYNAIDFKVNEMKNLLYVMKAVEHIIYDSLPSERSNNRFCKTLNKLTYQDLKGVDSLSGLHRLWYRKICDSIPDTSHYNDARYHGLNLHSRFYLGTIEFRYHEGTTKVKDISDWINLCNWIMNASRLMSIDSNLTSSQRRHRDKLRDVFIYYKGIKTSPIERIELIGGPTTADYIERRMSRNKH